MSHFGWLWFFHLIHIVPSVGFLYRPVQHPLCACKAREKAGLSEDLHGPSWLSSLRSLNLALASSLFLPARGRPALCCPFSFKSAVPRLTRVSLTCQLILVQVGFKPSSCLGLSNASIMNVGHQTPFENVCGGQRTTRVSQCSPFIMQA